MPNFKYRVRDRSGKAMAGTIDAPSLQMARDRLYQLGYFPIKIEEEGETVSFNPSDLWQRFQHVSLEEIVFFSQQLSTFPRGIWTLCLDGCPLPHAPFLRVRGPAP